MMLMKTYILKSKTKVMMIALTVMIMMKINNLQLINLLVPANKVNHEYTCTRVLRCPMLYHKTVLVYLACLHIHTLNKVKKISMIVQMH